MVDMAEEKIAESVLGNVDGADLPARARQAKAAGRAFRNLFGRKRKRYHMDYAAKPNPFRPPATPDLAHLSESVPPQTDD